MTTILSSKIRHRVSFAPSSEDSPLPDTPRFVDSRLIRDILTFPHNAKYIKFDDVVETIVELPGGKTQTVHSNPINFELFCVYSDEARRYEIFDDGSYAEIEVHPSLQGKVWVVANQKSQLAGQQIA